MRKAYSRSVLLGCLLLSFCRSTFALDAGLDVSQYAHTAWKVRDGFAKGMITSIAQTPDGYLWLGTEYGLYRFDGVRAVPWEPPPSQHLPDKYIRSLLVARDGTLWIGTLKGLASWKDGKLANYPEVAGVDALRLLQDREQTIWVGTTGPGRLCAVEAGEIQCYGDESFGYAVGALYEDHDGTLWVAAATGLWRWKPGRPEQHTFPRGVASTGALIEDDSGTLLLATNDGLKQFAGGKIRNFELPGVKGRLRPSRLFRSNDGSLWIATDQGLLHSHQGRVDAFGEREGLTSNSGGAIFQDREGNVWLGTANGLDRFREYAIPTISVNEGLSNSTPWSVQATADGSVWLGAPDALNRWSNGQIVGYRDKSVSAPERQPVEQQLGGIGGAREIANSGLEGRPTSLGLDVRGRLWVATTEGVFYLEGSRFVGVPAIPGLNVWSIADDGRGRMWFSNGTVGLFYFAPGDGVQSIPWSQLGQKGYGAIALLPDPSQGGLWLGFYEGGISHFKDGQIRASYTAADGLSNGRVNQLRFGSRDGAWAATEGGLSRFQNGHIETLSSRNGLPCDEVHWSIEDDDHAVWVYMPCGLARIERSEWHAWVDDPRHVVKTTVFDNSDGAGSVGVYGGFGPHVTKAPDGKIWFTVRDGVSVIDPRHLPFNKLPPPVHVEQIIADHTTYEASSARADATTRRLRLPPLIRDLRIDYTALSLVAPEKVRFRYKLEGWDRDWQDAGNRRQAFYSNLPPRKYRFRVAACNNSGVWNETGASVDFFVAPAYYQTWWFRLSCVAAFLAVLWGLYQYRVRELHQQFNIGLEARVQERTRIARDLHDTLLQSFQGVLLRFRAAANVLPHRPEEAKERLEAAIDQAAQAVTEGRNAVQGLRISTEETNNLAETLCGLGEWLASEQPGQETPALDVEVEGAPRDLHPILRDEVYRITCEAVQNAFRHAQASTVDVAIRYGQQELEVRIRDDGKGIDPQVLQDKGRAGHWGLSGMHERAKLVGGKLEVWSKIDSGTEIQLSIPASAAYDSSRTRRVRWFSRKGTAVKG